MRRKLLFPVLLLLVLAAFQTAAEEPIASVVIDPMEQPISMHWKDDSGRVIGNIGTLKALLEQGDQRLLLAMNGGMFTEDQAPLGTYVEEGVVVRQTITKAKGRGNFYLQPNGVFGVDREGRAFVETTAAHLQRTDALYATQSGPMLVVNDTINAAFGKASKNLNIRNGVGVLPDGKVLFAISREPVNFHDFAEFFRSKGCRNALYLDGVISRAYMPAEGLQQMGGALGPLIAVME